MAAFPCCSFYIILNKILARVARTGSTSRIQESMSTDIFSQTMIEAIRKYRETLRKYVPQGTRMKKLKQLGLKRADLNSSALSLYEAGYSIVKDIQEEDSFKQSDTGYYAYSGIKKFSEYLKNYLDQFEVIQDTVIHKSQLASQSLVKAIQLLSMPSKDNLTIKMVTDLSKCIRTIAVYGTKPQQELLKRTLNKIINRQKDRLSSKDEIPADLAFYQSVIDDFEQHMKSAQDN